MSTGVQYTQNPQQLQPQQLQYLQQGVQPEQKESFMEKYFYWASPSVTIYIILWIIIVIASIVTVGFQVCSVAHASAQWSYETSTFQNLN